MKSLTDNVPLRRTTEWANFKTDQPIPHRIAESSGELLQYDQERKVFVWAAHGCVSVGKVTANDIEVGGWQMRNGVDTAGRPACFIEFALPQDEGVTLVAYGVGKPHPMTGEPMDNPADVLWYLLADVVGNPVTYESLGDFRVECNRLGLRICGSFYRDDVTIQSEIRDICQSIGAVFCASSPGLARLYPGGTQKPALFTVSNAYGLSASTSRRTVVNDVTVNLAYVSGRAKATVKLEVPSSIAAFGRLSKVINATWINTTRIAVDVATRYLAQYSRPTWQVDVDELIRMVRVGDFIRLEHSTFAVAGEYMVLGSDLSLGKGTTNASVTVPVGPIGAVRLLNQSAAFTTNSYASVDIVTAGSDRTLTLKNDDGTPIANASVTLDGLYTRTTSNSGRVTFPVSVMGLGEHTLRIVTLDGRVLETTVVVT